MKGLRSPIIRTHERPVSKGAVMFMQIAQDLKVSLEDADNFKAFKVVDATASEESLRTALANADAGRLDGEHVWVSADWLRAQAGGSPEWDKNFEGLLAYAGSTGWLDDNGAVRAHIVDGNK